MRRLPLIVGLALVMVLTLREFYDFFVTNEGVRYFASEPRRLLHVVLLGFAGGFAAFWISRLSPGSQRTLKLTVLGTFGAVLLGLLGLFASLLASSAPMMRETGVWSTIVAALASFAVLAVLVWLEFFQVLRRT